MVSDGIKVEIVVIGKERIEAILDDAIRRLERLAVQFRRSERRRQLRAKHERQRRRQQAGTRRKR